jgi:hypothetical protein
LYFTYVKYHFMSMKKTDILMILKDLFWNMISILKYLYNIIKKLYAKHEFNDLQVYHIKV